MLTIGQRVPPYGVIAAVGVRDGEGYYMLRDRRGCVTLLPADCLEEHARLNDGFTKPRVLKVMHRE